MSDARPVSDSPTASVEQTLRTIQEIVEHAKSLPMSTSVRVERDELLDLVDQAIAQLPDEFRSARWLLKESDEVRAKANRQSDEIIAEAKSRAAHFVENSEVVKASKVEARKVLEDATAESNRMKREAEDYCDQKLASFEAVLDQIGQRVAVGRQRLAGTVEQRELADVEPDRPIIDHELD